ncbi:MAG TPA: lysylphosphatidylglycerol synthase transmembrane domain-containing protein [Vicinamibacterales bacterium]|nr:lysylphosphatidylglycerol synthase transmembrane domain-containing protein [Vicinamibacterales bacterium]
MSSEKPKTSLTRRLVTMGVKLAVSVALLWLLFSRIDVAKLWASARHASVAWMAIALAAYAASILVMVWRWWLLLEAQDVSMPFPALFGSMSVALFFNNFLPSNIGGDVVRISDTAKVARSKTLAATVVLADRTMGMMGLILVAATGVSFVASPVGRSPLPLWPSWLWAGFTSGMLVGGLMLWSPGGVGWILRPLMVLHPEWVGGRIGSLTATLQRFRNHMGAMITCFVGAVVVQVMTVGFGWAVARALGIPIGPFDLAVVVPLAGVVQMVPVSVNGFGVREATYSLYFTRIGLPIESAILLSLTSTALVMLYSLTGAAVYVGRGHH